MDKMISSFIKSASTAVWPYSVCIIILAVGSYIMSEELSPRNVFILTWMFLMITVIRTIALTLEDVKRWSRMPFWIKKLIVMPFIVGVTVTGVLNLGLLSLSVKTCIAGIAAIAGIVYVTVSLVEYIISKKKTDEMNDALLLIQKEISENE